MKRVGVITIQKCGNCGADLQAFALQAKLRQMGYDAESIDYLFYKHPRHRGGGRDERSIFRQGLANRAKELLFPVVSKARALGHWRLECERRRRFDSWFADNVRCGAEFRSVRELYAKPPAYDVYMVGSDQVWNPRMGGNILPYFLDFAPSGSRCVSYAASIGVPQVPAAVFFRYKRLLRRFAAIGVRERSAVDIVRAMGLDVEVRQALDPTLLLTAEDWARVAVRPPKMTDEPYLFLYDLTDSPETVALARSVAAARGLRIVRMREGAYGPGEFLWLSAHATAVVTNSFHGTVFAVVFHRDFLSVIPQRMSNGGRIVDLLRSMRLEDRLVRAKAPAGKTMMSPIDWERPQELLAAARADSVSFLRTLVDGPDKRVRRTLPLGCFAVWNSDPAVRARSTSGGFFRLLAEETIARGGVVFGASFTEDFRRVEHRAAETADDLNRLMKSKYVWSDPARAYDLALAELERGREVLFSGTPCQVAAMKKRAGKFDECLITVDIVCHGAPRADVFSSYIAELERRRGVKVSGCEFRNKRSGWNFPKMAIDFADGRRRISAVDPYFAAFVRNYSLREGCFACPFVGVEHTADYTMGDCWRIASSHPEWDDDAGTSLVLANTPRALAFVRRAIAGGRLKGGEYDLDLAQLRNLPLQQRASRPLRYRKFQETFDATGSTLEAVRAAIPRCLFVRMALVYWIKRFGWRYLRRHQ